MVSAIAIGVAGIIISIFLAAGGIDFTKKAIEQGKTLTKDAFDALGRKQDENNSTGTADRSVEDE